MKAANDNQSIAKTIPELTAKDLARFWKKVDKSGGPDACWPWLAGASKEGHGRFKLNGKLYSPHRISFELANGKIANVAQFHGTVIRHKCDNPPCCNPKHLEPGTAHQNALDTSERGRLKPRRGEAHVGSKLTDAKVIEIKTSKLSSRKMAAIIGCSDGTIREIRRGERWAHVAANDNLKPKDIAA